MNAKILVRVVAWREANKPVAWIARREGLDTKDVRAILRIAGDPTWKQTEIALDKYDRIEYYVNQGVTQSEIIRTVGCDNRTIKRWFPNVALKRGSREHQQAIQLGLARRRLEKS